MLILDTSKRPDVEKLITAQYWGELVGDADSLWTFKKHRGRILRPLLVLKFTNPSHCVLVIEFDMPLQGILVDQILWSHGVYLQPGRPGRPTRDNGQESQDHGRSATQRRIPWRIREPLQEG